MAFKRIIGSTFLIFFLCICINSCKESNNLIITSPVEPVDTIDTYKWGIDTLSSYETNDIYQLDSEHVYIASYPQSFIYQNKNFKGIGNSDFNFSALCISAIAPDYVVAAGWSQSTTKTSAAFKILRGNSETTVFLPGDTVIPDIRGVMIMDREKIWFRNGTDKLYYYDNGAFTTFDFHESLYLSIELFLVRNNELYVLGKLFENKELQQVKIYRIVGNSFEVVNTLSGTSYRNYKTSVLNDEFLFETFMQLYFPKNNNLEFFCDLPTNAYSVYSGTSRNDIIKAQGIFYQPGNIFTWNGNRWKKENHILISYNSEFNELKITKTKNNWVFIAANSNPAITFLYTGRKN